MLFLDLPALPGAILLQAPADPAASVETLLLDSRRVGLTAGAVFFALRGPRHDGHQHLAAAYAKGVRLFVVEYEPPSLAPFADAGLVRVPDARAALQALAARRRADFAGPVWAITGSNGKTIVKEWLAQLLAPSEIVCRSPRSFNSQVGVPLSVWELNPARHTLGIFEAGISEPGEMARLAAVIRPTHGLFTTLGPAHDAGFASRAQKLAGKLRLFEGAALERLFYCHDQVAVRQAVAARGLPGWAWSRQAEAGPGVETEAEPETEPGSDVRFTLLPAGPGQPVGQVAFRADWAGREWAFTLSFAEEPALENALHGVSVLLWRQLNPATALADGEMQRRLSRLAPVAMRLEMKAGRHDCYLLDDTYNNDLAGLALALDALSRQARPGGRTVILSDVLESGLPAEELYGRVARLLTAHGVTRLIGVGEDIVELRVKSYELRVETAASAGPESHSAGDAARAKVATTAPAKAQNQLLTLNSQLLTQFYPTTEALLAALRPEDFHRETILIKGARRFGFERVVAALQQPQHGTVLEVDLDALSHNLHHYRQRLRPNVRLMVMVKAFAYGSGSYEVASVLEFQRADYLAVAYADEGQALRENGIGLPIMVMNPGPDDFARLRRFRLEPEIYSFERLRDYLAAAEEAAEEVAEAAAGHCAAGDAPTARPLPLPPLHLKLDTGMARLGFQEDELPALLALLREHPARLPVAGLMTHLAAADDPAHDDFTREQLAAFGRMSAAIEAALGYSTLKHALNSAGIDRFPAAQLDMVRLGVGLYGVAPGPPADPALAHHAELRPVSTLKTTVSQVKTLPAGASVGYGRRGAPAAHARRLATLAIGYADGYDRRFSGGVGQVLLHGQLAPVVGSVCMDMVMVDVTHIPRVRAGDVAVVFGPDLPPARLAARIGTIAYELLTNVSERVKRIFISETA